MLYHIAELAKPVERPCLCCNTHRPPSWPIRSRCAMSSMQHKAAGAAVEEVCWMSTDAEVGGARATPAALHVCLRAPGSCTPLPSDPGPASQPRMPWAPQHRPCMMRGARHRRKIALLRTGGSIPGVRGIHRARAGTDGRIIAGFPGQSLPSPKKAVRLALPAQQPAQRRSSSRAGAR